MKTASTVSSSVAEACASALAPVPAAAVAGGWRLDWAQPAFRRSLVLILVLLFGILLPCVPGFFRYIQTRVGHPLADPWLALLPRHDVSNAIFLLIWGAVVAGVGWLCFHPRLLLRGLWALFILTLLRMLVILAVPLEPPLGLVPLVDPVTARLFQTTEASVITKDLFFSGHTATVALLALAVRGRWWRWALGLMAVAVGVLVLVQRVHYTYDVLAAPLFTYLAYWLGGQVARRATSKQD